MKSENRHPARGRVADGTPPRTKVARVYEELKRAIIAGEYPPGSRIVADQVSQSLGVSKVPTREALLRLAGEGWIDLSPHVGATVPHFDPNEILETALIRAAIESAAVRLATPHLSADDLARLRQLLERMDEDEVRLAGEYPRLNYDFHLLTVAACPYARMRELVEQIAQKTMQLRTTTFVPNYLPASQQEHWRLLEALEARDGDLAEQLVKAHVERAGRLLWEHATLHARALGKTPTG